MENERTEDDTDDYHVAAAGGFRGKINRSFDYDSDLVQHYDPDSDFDRHPHGNLDVGTNFHSNTRPTYEPDSALHNRHVYSPGNDAYSASEGDVTGGDSVTVDMNHTDELVNDFVDGTLDSVVLEERNWAGGEDTYAEDDLSGLENEAYSYDGDADTDVSYSHPAPTTDPGHAPPVLRNPDPFPVLERPLSGRYQKNPNLERNKTPAAPGLYDPNIGVFLAPPPVTTTKTSVHPSPKKRLPRPPSRLKMRCALTWSCLACLIGSFFCAIPALRYYVTANESRRIGDYNSAHSFIKKSAILAAVALALGVGAWVVVILYLTNKL